MLCSQSWQADIIIMVLYDVGVKCIKAFAAYRKSLFN